MNVSRFSIAELYNNSQGKTSLSLVCAHTLVLTGCIIGIKGAFTSHGETLLQGIAYATLGATLLGIRRWTPDKKINEDNTSPDPVTVTETKTETTETKTEIK